MSKFADPASVSLLPRRDAEAADEASSSDAHDSRIHGFGSEPPPRRASRLWAGGLVALVAACGLVVASFNAGRRLGQEDLAAFAAEVAGEPLDVAVASDSYLGYGNLTKYPFLAAGYGVLVEPHRSSTLRVGAPKAWASYAWRVGASTKQSLDLADLSADVEAYEDALEVSVLRTTTGAYSLVLTESVQGVTTREVTLALHCKYVRREIRDLTLADRERYLTAAQTVWTTSTRAGRLEHGYGAAYRDINTLAVIHNDLAGNTVCDHLHGTVGYAFLTGHVALNNMLEQSLQAVDPSVALAYWSYTRDTVECATKDAACFWGVWDSELFTADFFGSRGDKGVIADGRWANTQVPVLDEDFYASAMIEGHYREHSYAGCYGQDSNTESGCSTKGRNQFREKSDADAFVNWADKHVENAYGQLRSPWNMNSNPHVTRSGDMCGTKNDAQFPDCMSVISQQESFNSFSDWVLAMQFSPHGATHLFVGGAFGDCDETLRAVKDKVSSATFSRLLDKTGDLMKNMFWYEYVACPSRDACSATRGESNEAGGCTCSCPALAGATSDSVDHAFFDAFQAYQYLLEYLSPAMKEEVQALAASDKFALMSAYCNSNILLGDMLTSNSPLDVTFFNIHAEVERIWQRKALSGTLTDTTWPYPPGYDGVSNPACPGQCPGYRMVWMDYVFDGQPGKLAKTDYAYSKALKNQEFLRMLTPDSKEYAEAIPYVYDRFTWDGCKIPKKYKAYMDSSLMGWDQWVGPEDVAWLQDATTHVSDQGN